MAKLIKCKACGGAVSAKAPTCPHCGEPMKRKPIGCGGAIGIVFLALVIGSIWYGSIAPTPAPSAGGQSVRSAAPAVDTAQPAVPGAQWSYQHSDDAMSGKKTHSATVRSTNVVEFGFPYAGPQRGSLTLRTHPRFGKDVIFQIERGQIQCTTYDGCSALIRFDDGEAVTFAASAPEDNSTEIIFIQNYSGFVEKMLKASTVRISVSIYQEGSPHFEFNVGDFSQAKYLPDAQ